MEKLYPVIISIALIIVLAILSEYSKTVAAISTTMPTKIPLALWIVYAAEHGNRQKMAEFNEGMFISILPTVLFILATWWASRASWGLIPMVTAGYVAWGISLGLIFTVRSILA